MHDAERTLGDIQRLDDKIDRFMGQRKGMVDRYLDLSGWTFLYSQDKMKIENYVKSQYVTSCQNAAMSVQIKIEKGELPC